MARALKGFLMPSRFYDSRWQSQSGSSPERRELAGGRGDSSSAWRYLALIFATLTGVGRSYVDGLTDYVPSGLRTKVRFNSFCIRPTYWLIDQPHSIVSCSQLRTDNIVHIRSTASSRDHSRASIPSSWSASIVRWQLSRTAPIRSSQAAAAASSVSRAASSALAIP